MVASEIINEYKYIMENTMDFNLDYNYTMEPENNYSSDTYIVVDSIDEFHFQKILVSCIYPLIFLLGSLGNLLVIVILWHYRHSRTSTEQFLFHLALANLLLVFTFPFGIVEVVAGWVLGPVLCKIISATNKINFYSSSMLLGCISVDRYLAVVHALQTFQKPRALSVHLICLAVWFLSILLVLPDLLFTMVWEYGNFKLCHFMEYGEDGINSWLATRFLYHIVGFFLPSLLMCYCYAAIIRALCRSRRLQRHKAIKVAILVTSVFLICWIPYHVIIFLDTLKKLNAISETGLDGIKTAISLSEVLAYTHCCLNPFLYAFVGVRFRHDICRLLHDLGCISQTSLQEILGTGRTDSSTETNVSIIRPSATPNSTNASGSPGAFFPLPVWTDQMVQKEDMGIISEKDSELKTGGTDLE